MRVPPQMINDDYPSFKHSMEIWEELTDVPLNKRALLVHLSLTGKAQKASEELGIEVLKTDQGMTELMKRLDRLYLQNSGLRQFNAFYNLNYFRRSEETNLHDFMGEFEHMYFKLEKENVKLPDTVIAFCLLSCCNLSETDRNLVMVGQDEITYDNMKAAILRVFGNRVGIKGMSSSDPHLSAEKPSDVLYAGNNYRGRGNSYSRGGFSRRGRGRYNRYQANANENPRQTDQYRTKPKFQISRDWTNPLIEGKKTRCYECDSTEHWRANCPGKYRARQRDRAMFARGNDKEEDEEEEDYVMFTMSDSSKVNNVTMFVGCAGDTVMVNSLVDDSKGCGVLDSGCTKTVCGERWVNDYLDNLSDFERSLVKEESSPASFTFGDGITVKSKKKLTLPCMIGGMKGKVVTDVVTCDIPLLLSKKSMKSVGMILNFKEDNVKIGKKTISLHSTTSGHYALPLCL